MVGNQKIEINTPQRDPTLAPTPAATIRIASRACGCVQCSAAVLQCGAVEAGGSFVQAL